MSNMDSRPEVSCDLVGLHDIGPIGDVILVLHSKNAIVSAPLEVELKTAQQANDQGDIKNIYNLGEEDIELKASSHTLASASPYWKALLFGNLAEAEKLRKDGHVRIVLEDDSVHGTFWLLKLLHFDHNRPELTPSLIMQVAILVDKWGMAESLSDRIKQWWIAMHPHVPNGSQWKDIAELINWLGIASMLNLKIEAQRMEKLVWPRTKEVPYCGEFPIQHRYEAMQARRLRVLETAFQPLKKFVEERFDGRFEDFICGEDCDVFVLGHLLRKLAIFGYFPFPKEPFPGISVAKLKVDLDCFNIESLCWQRRRSGEVCENGDYFKLLHDTIVYLISELENRAP